MTNALAAGVTVDRYRVVEPIGRGGMGEVYKAWDATLERAIALKILPPALVRNSDRLRRFVQEAKSASSLNHPHIITIHDVGAVRLRADDDDSNVHYIAMELVDGETLRQKIRGGAGLRTLVGWLAQAADGLAKAHAAGIVHRDLKPDNIMITRDGYAKVLDFGLAKLAASNDEGFTDRNAATQERTREGFLVGTIGYMSPEQVQGRAVDARSDIFSFGCILYEAATGRKPFDADSDVDLMHKILHDKPEPIDRLNASTPAELRRIVRRCLAKEPEQRYQSIKDLSLELRELFEEWETLSQASDPRDSSPTSPHAMPTLVMRAPDDRKRVPWLAIGGGVLLLALVAAGAAYWRLHRAPRFTPERLKIAKLTNSGNVTGFAMSPDGRYLVQQTVDDDRQASLWLKQTATGSNVRIAGPTRLPFRAASFSPDGNYVYYVSFAEEQSEYSVLFRVPTLGGTPSKLIFDVDTAPTFSPDGKRIAFIRGYPQREEAHLMVANADGSGEKSLSVSKNGAWYRQILPSWSPDGRSIAVDRQFVITNPHDELDIVDVATGAVTPLGGAWTSVGGVQWMPDGSGVVVTGVPLPATAFSQVAFVAYPSGEVTRIWSDTNNYRGVSIAADGKTIAVGQQTRTSVLYTSNTDGTGLRAVSPADVVVTEIAAGSEHPSFAATNGQAEQLWVLDPSGNAQQLTAATNASTPSSSRDGSSIVFTSTASGKAHQYFIHADGTGLRQLTSGDGECCGSISPDGESHVYIANRNLYRQSVRGGAPVLLATRVSDAGVYSCDGKFIAFGQYLEENGQVQAVTSVMPASGGAPVWSERTVANRNYRWGPASDTLVQWDSVANANVVLRSLKTNETRQLTHFESGRINDVAFSADGSKMFIARGEKHNDVVLITDFR